MFIKNTFCSLLSLVYRKFLLLYFVSPYFEINYLMSNFHNRFINNPIVSRAGVVVGSLLWSNSNCNRHQKVNLLEFLELLSSFPLNSTRLHAILMLLSPATNLYQPQTRRHTEGVNLPTELFI
jgi:hypothetical protein